MRHENRQSLIYGRMQLEQNHSAQELKTMLHESDQSDIY